MECLEYVLFKKNCNSKQIMYSLETIPAVVTIDDVESA